MTDKKAISIPDQIIGVSHSLEHTPVNKVREDLLVLLNDLINQDFSILLQLLYRIDINEKKIRLLLEKNPTEDSASIIADLIIERQLQKIESRKLFKENQDPDCGEERW